jgi:hypothetical protein
MFIYLQADGANCRIGGMRDTVQEGAVVNRALVGATEPEVSVRQVRVPQRRRGAEVDGDVVGAARADDVAVESERLECGRDDAYLDHVQAAHEPQFTISVLRFMYRVARHNRKPVLKSQFSVTRMYRVASHNRKPVLKSQLSVTRNQIAYRQFLNWCH